MCLNKSYSQDSLATNPKLPWLSIKAMQFPITYGILFGYGYIGLIEKRIAKNQTICVGTKFLRAVGGTPEIKNRLLLLEYRYYLSIDRDEAKYISPYIILRDLNYSDYEGGGVRNSYNEKSLGLGFTFGHTFYLNEKKWLEANTFLGGGYFLNLKSEGYTYVNGISRIEYKPATIITRFDLRLGLLLGFNFH